MYIVCMPYLLLQLHGYIQSYYNKVYNRAYFIAIAGMMALLLVCNYSGILSHTARNLPGILTDYLVYFLPFALAYLLQWICYKEPQSYFSKGWFWIIVLVAPAMFVGRINISFIDSNYKNLADAIAQYLCKAIVLVVPVIVYWYIKDRKFLPLYGIKPVKNLHLYFILWLLMIPLVILSCVQPAFLAVYPKATVVAGLSGLHDIGKILLFEIVYGIDFLSIEFFFRGFLVIGLARLCGHAAIIPAACFYCCIHFGKPAPEAISSFFGALLLGILSYNSKSIRGCFLVHVGIAWLMELAAFIAH